MVSITDFATNKKKEKEGVWVDIGEGAKLKLARIGNAKYEDALLKKSKNIRGAVRRGKLNDPRLKTAMIDAMSQHVLLGWKGITAPGEDGKEHDVEYSSAKAKEWLTDHQDFYNLVSELASDASYFKDDEAEGN